MRWNINVDKMLWFAIAVVAIFVLYTFAFHADWIVAPTMMRVVLP